MMYDLRGQPLSDRELSVLRALARGETAQETGRRLEVSEHTVRSHARRVRLKLGALTTAHAVALATASGLIEPENTP